MHINQITLANSNVKSKRELKNNSQGRFMNGLDNGADSFAHSANGLNTHKRDQTSFGIDPIITPSIIILAKTIGAMLAMSAATVAVSLGTIYMVSQISEWVDERRKKAQEAFKLQVIKDQNAIYDANKAQITKKRAQELYNEGLEMVAIEPNGSGDEVGLNNIIGCDLLKLGLARNVLLPMLQVMDGSVSAKSKVPNGINFFGPAGTGKTFLAKQLGNHYVEKGGYFEEIEFIDNDEKDIETMKKAFATAEKRFKESGNKKYTMILLDELEKNARSTNLPDSHPARTSALLKLMNECKDKGVVLVSTSNDLTMVAPDVLRKGRTDLRVPVGSVDIHDAADMINFYVQKSGVDSEQLDYKRLTEAIKSKNLAYKPKELEAAVGVATMYISDGYLDTDMILKVIDKSDLELNEDDIRLFDTEKELVKKLGGINENARRSGEDTV